MVNLQMQPLCIADGDVHPRVRLAGVIGRGLLRKVCLNVWFNACVSWICVGAHNGIRVQPPLRQLGIGHASKVGQVGHPQPTCGLSIRAIPGFNRDEHRPLPHVPAAAIEQAVTFFWLLVRREITVVQLDFAGKHNRFIHLAHRLCTMYEWATCCASGLSCCGWWSSRYNPYILIGRRSKACSCASSHTPGKSGPLLLEGPRMLDAAGFFREAYEKFFNRHPFRLRPNQLPHIETYVGPTIKRINIRFL